MLEKWDLLIQLLQGIHSELQTLGALVNSKGGINANRFVHLPFKGSEIYLLRNAFIDAGGCPNENYKSLLETTVPFLSNKTKKGFSPQIFMKYSDNVDPESKDTVKLFLQRMIRNVESYD